MVRRLVIEGDDGLRRWGYWVDDGIDDDQEAQFMMPAGTMRSSLPGQFINRGGGAFATFETSLRPAKTMFGHAQPMFGTSPARAAEMRNLNAGKPGLTHHRWGTASPFTPRPVEPVAESAPTRPMTVSGFPSCVDRPLPTHARFQIEMLKGRQRYSAKLADGGGRMLTRTTGY